MAATLRVVSEATARAEGLVTVGQIRDYFGIAKSTLYRWQGEGFPPPVALLRHRGRSGRRRVLYEWSAVRRFVETGR